MRGAKLRTVAALALVGVAALLFYLIQNNSRLREENLALRNQQPQAGQTSAHSASSGPESLLDQDRKPGELANTTVGDSNAVVPSHELLRLRGEVTVLRNQVAEIAKTQRQKEMILAKMDSAKQVCIAFATYALDHQDQIPTDIDLVAPLLASTGFQPTKLTNLFEIVYQGTHDVPQPANIIFLREREAWPAPQGGWYRTYGFADNHSELHYSPDGDFTAWEDQHRPKPVGQ